MTTPPAAVCWLWSKMRGRCHRCKKDVEGVYAHPRLRKLAFLYPLLVVPFVPVLPIIASDYIVMIPSLMVYMLGFGPVLALIREPPTCVECGALLSKGPLPLRRSRRARFTTDPGLVCEDDTLPPEA